MSAANTFTTVSLSMPIPSVTGGAKTATIMELLYVEVHPRPGTMDLIADDDGIQFALSIGAAPGSSVPVIGQTTTIERLDLVNYLTTSGSNLLKLPIRMDLQDANGYGWLLAADTLNVSANSVGQAAAVVIDFRIYYRFVTLPISEYVGIVTSLMT